MFLGVNHLCQLEERRHQLEERCHQLEERRHQLEERCHQLQGRAQLLQRQHRLCRYFQILVEQKYRYRRCLRQLQLCRHSRRLGQLLGGY
jgi:hypothetical protein